MTTLNIKPLAQHLTQQIVGLFSRHSILPQTVEPTQTARHTAQPAQGMDTDAETAFLASIADLPEAERAEQIQRREWYARLAARQGIAEVEWRTEQYQRSGEAPYRL